MKKKIISIVMIVAIVAVCLCAFAACGKKDKVEAINIDLSSEQYAFAVRKTDTALLNSVNQFFAEKMTEVNAILNKYLNATADELAAMRTGITYQTSGDVNNTDSVLVVATNLEFSPFEYINGSEAVGADMEIAKLLAEYLHQTLVVVNMEFDAVVTSVQTLTQYDIGIAGLTITEERKESVNFSSPYFGTTQVLVVKEGDTTFAECTTAAQVEEKLASLTGNAAKCGGQSGTTSQFYVEGSDDLGFNGFANLTFAPYSSAALAIQDMINGNIAFVLVDKAVANSLVKSING